MKQAIRNLAITAALILPLLLTNTKAGIKVEFQEIWKHDYGGILEIAQPLSLTDVTYGYLYPNHGSIIEISEKTGEVLRVVNSKPDSLGYPKIFFMQDTNYILGNCYQNGKAYKIHKRTGEITPIKLPQGYTFFTYILHDNSIICVHNGTLKKYFLDSSPERIDSLSIHFPFLDVNANQYTISPQGNYMFVHSRYHREKKQDDPYDVGWIIIKDVLINLKDFSVAKVFNDTTLKYGWTEHYPATVLDTFSYVNAAFSDDETKLALVPTYATENKWNIDIVDLKNNFTYNKIQMPNYLPTHTLVFDSTGKYLFVGGGILLNTSKVDLIIDKYLVLTKYPFTNYYYTKYPSRKYHLKIEENGFVNNTNSTCNISYNNHSIIFSSKDSNILSKFDLFDTSGKLIFTQTNLQIPNSLSLNLASGIYFVSFQLNNLIYSQKIIVE